MTDDRVPAFCDVCGTEFLPERLSDRRCSETCRVFARKRRSKKPDALAAAWAASRAAEIAATLGVCPSGKVRHQRKSGAERSARSAVRQRYEGLPSWLRVYQCDRCFGGWHLTSKPKMSVASLDRAKSA